MSIPLNRLEIALIDQTNVQLDFYLKLETAANIRQHIAEIQKRAAIIATSAGDLEKRISEKLASINA